MEHPAQIRNRLRANMKLHVCDLLNPLSFLASREYPLGKIAALADLAHTDLSNNGIACIALYLVANDPTNLRSIQDIIQPTFEFIYLFNKVKNLKG